MTHVIAWSWGFYIVMPPLDGLVCVADGPGPYVWRAWVRCTPTPAPLIVPDILDERLVA